MPKVQANKVEKSKLRMKKGPGNKTKPKQERNVAAKDQKMPADQKDEQNKLKASVKNILQVTVKHDDLAEDKKEFPKDKDVRPRAERREMRQLVISDESIQRFEQVAIILPAPEMGRAIITEVRQFVDPDLQFLARLNMLPVRQGNNRHLCPRLIRNRSALLLHCANRLNNEYERLLRYNRRQNALRQMIRLQHNNNWLLFEVDWTNFIMLTVGFILMLAVISIFCDPVFFNPRSPRMPRPSPFFGHRFWAALQIMMSYWGMDPK
ncbi:uncharacterized protein Dana_GF22415, isoform B [Drosophila ananassae]|uniref:Uncharacterized protein, isoform B n=1 Tax=Drosophila ananassae TaxID=7217 RepID=A0A0P8ZKR6_DROAN|nr:uncharacterized protein LOC6505076 isoform X2 [Drosophila ananassae]KPU75400.1 uncharacterized protein Dana_GF22415, isoform B [Drosophila ananassae]